MVELRVFGPLLCVVALGACDGTTRPPTAGSPGCGRVVYQVSGSAKRAAVTYEDGAGNTSYEIVDLPWRTTIESRRPGDFLYVSGQSRSDHGSVVARIELRGAEYKAATAKAPYGLATAAGYCPG
ncbi:hypothetical protein E4K72_07940 [Oxalobacteraceae bacterium OM1]|nr:hypothetical protein E4K72_07940 [Oxalobacteraceae bacterium OM1]